MSDNAISVPVKDNAAPVGPSMKLEAGEEKTLKQARAAQRLEEAQGLQLVGAKVLKIRISVLAKAGEQIAKLGVKHLGYGYLASANDNADNALAECDKLIAGLLANGGGVDPDVIVSLMQLKLGFNKQIIEVGENHLRADRNIGVAPTGNNLMMPFPAGQSVTVSVNPSAIGQIENGNPKA